MNRITTGVIVSLLIAAAALAWTTHHYRDNAIQYKSQRDTARHNLKLANETISDMQQRQRDVAALDAKYTKELADAKATIESLSADVAAGKRRLYLNATCAGKADATRPSGMDDAPAARLTPDAERDYWRLRAGIETVTKQVAGLQDYIREQCLK
ncbi:lysis protein [Salmonella enterica]|uniref:Lysis protein n=1 Tax=Salmonella enterica TaxID=28901 RepID=A0A5U2F9A6_SALER|nr:lysis protein [Salmonella enterica]